VPDVSPLRNVKFRVPLTFTAAKVFVNMFSRKYYFTNNLEITLAGAKFWTLCCVPSFGSEVDAALKEYVDLVGNWTRANCTWNFETRRYFGDKGLDVQQKRWVPLLPRVVNPVAFENVEM